MAMDKSLKVLIVDDDKNICDLLRLYLEKDGYSVILSHDGEEAVVKFNALKPDIVLLDIMLPGIDGLELLQRIRENRRFCNIPVVLATAKGAEYDKIKGLDLGADYYLVKPFGVMELVSCVKAVLRRCRAVFTQSSVIKAGGLVLNSAEHKVFTDGEPVLLTYKEFELLKLFLSNPGIAFTRDQLMQEVWGTDYCGETRTVDMHIRTLRQKLGKYGAYIKTVRNVGYQLEANI